MKREAESAPGPGAKCGPPGPGQGWPLLPQGLELLLRRAASDLEFRDQLLDTRAAAAAAIGLALDPAEQAMLASIPRAQLLLTIERINEAGDRRRGFLLKLAFAALVAAAAGGVWLWRRREPAYRDKSLSEWLRLGEQFGWTYQQVFWSAGAVIIMANAPITRTPPKAAMTEVEEALCAIGTKAVPSMLAMLHTKDPSWKLKLMNWLGKQSTVKVPFTKAATYQKRAVIGLTVLGPLATNAVPAIQTAMADTNKVSDWEFQAYAKEALERITGKQ